MRFFATALLASAVFAAPASAAVTITGNITPNGTSDTFFNWIGGDFSVAVDPAALNGIPDPELFLFADDGSASGALTGTLIGRDDDSGDGFGALFTGSLAAGNYVLSVGTFNFTQNEARRGTADYTRGETRFRATFSDGVTINRGPVGAVPEPATWAMMIGGFGLVGSAMRRRRQTTAVTFA
ncbi:hypothetical protein GGR88_000776 [Sphingomonas jejuensis]|uniref:Ice-binding protein C-terminal domain-containing protein n=2 Tax=Sphingomonas jejuensis TaxID=904715 RepID=A0ABX0XKJ3_9SPHN|nr:hypothetical protein [Sphingomonas jejuensis]